MSMCLNKCLSCVWTTATQYINLSECFSERDAFDTLFDHAPDKLNVVKKVGRFLFFKYIMCACACACLCVSVCTYVVSVYVYNIQLA